MTGQRLRRLALLVVAAVLVSAFALRPVDDPRGPAGVAAAGRPGAAAATGLAALQADAGRLLDGGPRAFRARLRALRGVPVVVNQWASWCGPCRAEFPFFQRLARHYSGRVAFLGVNSQDVRDDAYAFLREFRTPFPHYVDEDVAIARLFGGGRAWPTTAFYDASGRLTRTHLGGYATERELDADLRRWALGT